MMESRRGPRSAQGEERGEQVQTPECVSTPVASPTTVGVALLFLQTENIGTGGATTAPAVGVFLLTHLSCLPRLA